jgi:hypothetical protein
MLLSPLIPLLTVIRKGNGRVATSGFVAIFRQDNITVVNQIPRQQASVLLVFVKREGEDVGPRAKYAKVWSLPSYPQLNRDRVICLAKLFEKIPVLVRLGIKFNIDNANALPADGVPDGLTEIVEPAEEALAPNQKDRGGYCRFCRARWFGGSSGFGSRRTVEPGK